MVAGVVALGGMGDVRLELFTQGVKAIPLYPAKATDKVRLLPSGVQGLVPTEAPLSSFAMNRSLIVLCGRADSWTWSS
ncbi:hypothetical protein AVEN_241664-1 [Araneus ventricosus]|uniref:Uncharacterized protein n=1 Tax=Araneus ventricosus TaxID=182803 RepID=A0A4Y2MGP2_ARAVE|nr:hypothetical protein AVEN_241664-1 [Araneus ventricosus]